MKKRVVTNKIIIMLSFLVFTALIVIWYGIGVFQQKRNHYEYILTDGWDVYENGVLYAENCDITKINFGSLDRGDELDFAYGLTSDLDGGYTVEILTYLCSFEAYVDDELIYSYAPELIDKNVMVGSGYHFVDLPKEVDGKTLFVKMIMNQKNAFTSVSSPRAARTSSSELIFAKNRFVDCLIGFFLLVLGVILAISSIIALVFDRSNFRLLLIGFFSICIGGWSIFGSKAWQVFSEVRGMNSTLEYVALYLAPVPFTLLVCLMKRDVEKRWKRVVLRFVFVVFSFFAVVSTILHFTNIMRYPDVLATYHILGMLGFLTIMLVGFLSERKKSDADIVTVLAIVVFMSFGVLDLLRFNFQKYIYSNNDLIKNSFIPLGPLVFVMLLIVSYLLYLYDMVMTNTEKDMLLKMAYHDSLTGLFNRAKFEEHLTELENSSLDFAIISFDLNGLKEVNDTLGHSQGDELLIDFSNVLLQTFYEIGKTYRTGGDEFVVIVDEDSVGKIHEALVDFNMNQADASKDKPFIIQASYGVAYRSEADSSDSFMIFRLADKRMYEMKSELKGKEYIFAKKN